MKCIKCKGTIDLNTCKCSNCSYEMSLNELKVSFKKSNSNFFASKVMYLVLFFFLGWFSAIAILLSDKLYLLGLSALVIPVYISVYLKINKKAKRNKEEYELIKAKINEKINSEDKVFKEKALEENIKDIIDDAITCNKRMNGNILVSLLAVFFIASIIRNKYK